VDGAIRFARYAYPPNALGYCGPEDSAAVFGYASSGRFDPGLVDLARRFAGAWPYLTLIAACNQRLDPLDPAVVEAYWLGNALLERVPPSLFANHLTDRFADRAGRHVVDLAHLALLGGKPHHNFHVFAVYPWVGLLRAERAEEPLRVLDSCRIAWGRVLAVHSGQVEVATRDLEWDGRHLALRGPTVRPARTALASVGLAPAVRVGDTVALHWDWVCDVLTPHQAAALRRYTERQLALTNDALCRPVAAAVLH
jgi:uncharacterized protein DUF6390